MLETNQTSTEKPLIARKSVWFSVAAAVGAIALFATGNGAAAIQLLASVF